jgi:hypothetical protein
MSRSPRTRAQTRAAQQARAAHRSWLAARDLDEMNGWLNEAAFTAILLAALLDPDSRDTVTTALLADAPAEALHAHGPLTLQSAPGSVMDLILGFGEQPDMAAVVIEAKRFESPSNECRSAQGEWLWQTDVAVEDSAEVEPPGWLWGVHHGQIHDFVLIDAFSRPASTVFPGARHNHRWRTVGYAEIGATLRTAYDCGIRGLVPLLTTLWADSSHRF